MARILPSRDRGCASALAFFVGTVMRAFGEEPLDGDGDGLPDSWERGVGRYEIISGSFSWIQAREDAARRGAHLATVVSASEWADIKAVLGSALPGKNLWLGGTDEQTEGAWRWVTGEKWTFANWRQGEPNNDSLGNGTGAPEHFLLLWGNETAEVDGGGLFWNDVPVHGGVLRRDGYLLERGAWTDFRKRDTDDDGLPDGGEAPMSTTYRLVPGSFSWTSAKSDAELRGGHLAVITNASEWGLVQAALGPTGLATRFWLGASDAQTEGTWRWITGDSMTFTRWAVGTPNNVGDADHLIYDPTSTFWKDARDDAVGNRSAYLLESPFLSATDANNPDTDSDGLTDGDEVNLHRSNPGSTDTDEDSLGDFEEVRRWGTDPTRADTDGDALTDSREVFVTRTDPTRADTDGDGFDDGIEVAMSKNPLDPADSLIVPSRRYGAIEVEFDTQAGQRYQVQTRLSQVGWSNVDLPVVGDGNPYRRTFSGRGARLRIYRVPLVP